MAEVVLVVLLIPLVWSAVVCGLRRLAGHPVPDDRAEKYQLLIMVTPVLIGAIWISVAPWVSASLPSPWPRLDESPVALPRLMVPIPAAVLRTGAGPEPWLTGAMLAAWGIGACVRAVPMAVTLVRLGRLAARAETRLVGGVPVRIAAYPLPPLALGRATVLIPAGLMASMSSRDLALIIRHEQAHLGRKDPYFFALLSLLDAALWFNPFLHGQTQRCRLAAELACDAAASGKNPEEREAYARVLIQTLKHTAGTVRSHAPAAISNVKSGDYRMRLSEIMHAAPAVRKPKRRWIYGALAVALVPVAALQFAWAKGSGVPPAPAPASAAASDAAPPFTAPVPGPISTAFGVRTDPRHGQARFHQGVDFPVAAGTPVRAAADGRVSTVTEMAGYGKVVEIDHGHGLLTRYAHLDQQKVSVGDAVKAGQVIASSGDTGTGGIGPHLHFEVWKDGRPQNPATALGLNVSAADESTLRAVRVRADGDVLAGEGGAELRVHGDLVQADYIRWNRRSGATEVRGHVTVTHADGAKTAGGGWIPAGLAD